MQPLRACPRCASRDMRMLTLQEGLVAGGGETLRMVCGACGYQGMPLLFDDEANYAAFREEHRGAPGAELSAAEAAERSELHAAAESRAALERPLPAMASERGLLDRLQVMPLFAFAVGGGLLVLGVLGVLGSVLSPEPFTPLRLATSSLYAFVGLAFLLIGRRAWRHEAG